MTINTLITPYVRIMVMTCIHSLLIQRYIAVSWQDIVLLVVDGLL